MAATSVASCEADAGVLFLSIELLRLSCLPNGIATAPAAAVGEDSSCD